MRHGLLLCLAVGFAALPAAVAVGQADRVRIQTVEVHSSDRGPVVLLKAEEKAIPIFVDYTVAGSIHAALSGRQTARPLSHDLMRAILESLDAKVTQTVITLKDQTFYGALSIATKDGTKVFDSRSSDSIALAVHFHAPIWVSRELLEQSGKSAPGSDRPQERL
jgi:hypothetical protein